MLRYLRGIVTAGLTYTASRLQRFAQFLSLEYNKALTFKLRWTERNTFSKSSTCPISVLEMEIPQPHHKGMGTHLDRPHLAVTQE